MFAEIKCSTIVALNELNNISYRSENHLHDDEIFFRYVIITKNIARYFSTPDVELNIL